MVSERKKGFKDNRYLKTNMKTEKSPSASSTRFETRMKYQDLSIFLHLHTRLFICGKIQTRDLCLIHTSRARSNY